VTLSLYPPVDRDMTDLNATLGQFAGSCVRVPVFWKFEDSERWTHALSGSSSLWLVTYVGTVRTASERLGGDGADRGSDHVRVSDG
jgi:hypothetical protein